MVQKEKNVECEQCHQLFINKQPNIPYWCGNCGEEGPFDNNSCPSCGSTLRKINIYYGK